jgi:hypothetical protein
MWNWDIVTVLLAPAFAAMLMLGMAIGVAWDEYKHRHR